MQIYVYHLSFKKDPVYIKLLGVSPLPGLSLAPQQLVFDVTTAVVYTVLPVDLLETGFAAHYGW